MGNVVPDRPVDVPPGARYFPPADDVSGLEEFHRNHPGRGYLRVLLSDCSEPVPGVWAWTLADERANPTPISEESR